MEALSPLTQEILCYPSDVGNIFLAVCACDSIIMHLDETLSCSSALSRRALLLVASLVICCAAPAQTSAWDKPCTTACSKACGPECAPPGGVCVEHDMWLVSTRCAPACGCLTNGVEQLKYYHYEDGCWIPSDKIGFLASDDPAVTTCIVIHGNQTDASTAKQFGLFVRKALGQLTPCNCRLRVVMWSWPADKAALRNKNDVNIKSPRSDAQGYYLAWLVDQIQPEVPVTMMGYSLGSRTIGGALQMLDGGVMAGRSLERRVHPTRAPLRAVYIAAALDNDWLCPGHCHGRSLNQVEYLLNLYNPRDPALRFYPLLERRPRLPDSLGFNGRACCSLGENAGKYCERSVASVVGAEHDWRYYFSARMMRLAAPYIFRTPCDLKPAAETAPAPVAESPKAIDPAPAAK